MQLWGLTGVQKEAVLAAKRSLVTVEEIVDELDPMPNAVVLPKWVVTRVAEVPNGAHPSYAHDYYERDNAYYREWDGISKDRDELRAVARRGGARMSDYTTDEMMVLAAARALPDGAACFVGIGLPSTAANLARRTHAPELVLIYEAGAIGAKPGRLPASIGDGILAETADAVISVPEVFNYWLQPGRIEIGFLGAAQIDRYANINTTVIGPDYDNPKVRLPGAGGAPEIAASCGEVVVIVRQSPRSFVEQVDFVTSVGYGHGPGDRERLGLRGRGPVRVITDLGVLEPDPETLRADADRRASRRRRRPGARGDRVGARGGERPEDLRGADRRGARRAARAPGDRGSPRESEALILDAVRTPFGRAGGALAGVRPDDLAAHAVQRPARARAGPRPGADRRRRVRRRQRRGRGQPQRRADGGAARRAADERAGQRPSTGCAARASTPPCRRAGRSRPATRR